MKPRTLRKVSGWVGGGGGGGGGGEVEEVEFKFEAELGNLNSARWVNGWKYISSLPSLSVT